MLKILFWIPSITIYTLTTVVNGCVASDEVVIVVTELIVLPNTFTPNGDGVNDFFRPLNCPVSQMQLMIYDRWGLKVFETSDPWVKWEGKTSSGNTCIDGTYYYLLNYTASNGSGILKKGFIQLNR